MAKKDVMTPGAYGGGQSSKKKDDSFSLGELLDAIIGRQQERTEAERRNEDFSRAFRSMLASPTEYTRWADDKYQRESAESKRINEAEAMRQGYEDRIRDQEEALARHEPPPPMRDLYDPHEGIESYRPEYLQPIMEYSDGSTYTPTMQGLASDFGPGGIFHSLNPSELDGYLSDRDLEGLHQEIARQNAAMARMGGETGGLISEIINKSIIEDARSTVPQGRLTDEDIEEIKRQLNSRQNSYHFE
tara:strand:+ start:1758 stop:2495 length:738 start_codon:yes stop_codon:yes gene_type:complete